MGHISSSAGGTGWMGSSWLAGWLSGLSWPQRHRLPQACMCAHERSSGHLQSGRTYCISVCVPATSPRESTCPPGRVKGASTHQRKPKQFPSARDIVLKALVPMQGTSASRTQLSHTHTCRRAHTHTHTHTHTHLSHAPNSATLTHAGAPTHTHTHTQTNGSPNWSLLRHHCPGLLTDVSVQQPGDLLLGPPTSYLLQERPLEGEGAVTEAQQVQEQVHSSCPCTGV